MTKVMVRGQLTRARAACILGILGVLGVLGILGIPGIPTCILGIPETSSGCGGLEMPRS